MLAVTSQHKSYISSSDQALVIACLYRGSHTARARSHHVRCSIPDAFQPCAVRAMIVDDRYVINQLSWNGAQHAPDTSSFIEGWNDYCNPRLRRVGFPVCGMQVYQHLEVPSSKFLSLYVSTFMNCTIRIIQSTCPTVPIIPER